MFPSVDSRKGREDFLARTCTSHTRNSVRQKRRERKRKIRGNHDNNARIKHRLNFCNLEESGKEEG